MGKRGIIDLSELPQYLPCSEALWEAPNAASWKAFLNMQPQRANDALFSTCLHSVLADEPVQADLSVFGKKLCAQGIGRLLSDLKQLDIVQAPDLLQVGAFSDAQGRMKEKLLHGLDALRKSLSNPSSITGLIHHKHIDLSLVP